MQDRVPIFDSMTHPTPTGEWLAARWGAGNTFARLVEEMDGAGVTRALAVGMKGVGGYEASAYVRQVREWGPRLTPVAFCDFACVSAPRGVRAYLRRLQALGYAAIKIHPRLSEIVLLDARVECAVQGAAELGMGVLLCTYAYEPSPRCLGNRLEDVQALLTRIQGAPLVLVHGGGVRLLEMAEVVRSFPHTLLDLSLTLCKYAGSSLDLDIRFLFERFDRRICVGSDSPEFGLRTLRERFDGFSAGLPPEKVRNVASGNLAAFLPAGA